jgi:hypothetical protein
MLTVCRPCSGETSSGPAGRNIAARHLLTGIEPVTRQQGGQGSQRQFGCYVMPVLSGERLIGRVASRVDRRRRVFDVEAMFAEAGAPADRLVPPAIEALASFAGADSVHYSGPVALGVS